MSRPETLRLHDRRSAFSCVVIAGLLGLVAAFFLAPGVNHWPLVGYAALAGVALSVGGGVAMLFQPRVVIDPGDTHVRFYRPTPTGRRVRREIARAAVLGVRCRTVHIAARSGGSQSHRRSRRSPLEPGADLTLDPDDERGRPYTVACLDVSGQRFPVTLWWRDGRVDLGPLADEVAGRLGVPRR